jgi:HSP20 family protein
MKEKFSIDPMTDMKNYREALRQVLEGGWVLPRDMMPSAMNAVVIPVDVLDNGPEIVVKANLPGVKPEDVLINVTGETLTIRATLDEEDEIRGATYLRRERNTNAFVRALNLPCAVEAQAAEARYKNGLLTLTLPKASTIRPRSIKVQPE